MATIIDKLAWMHFAEVEGKRSVLFARSHGENLFYCPGGKREGDETDEIALIREVLQETCGVLIPETIKHMHTFVGPAHKQPDAELQMKCYTARHQSELRPASEVDELAWFTTADMHRTTVMGQEILSWLHEQGLID